LVVLAAVSAALLVTGLITSTVMAGETFPAPFAPAEDLQAYFRDNARAVAVTAFFTFASGVPLAISGLLWLIVAGALLPRRRRPASA
jgi:hypothetical protein